MSEINRITGNQIAAALALLRMGHATLAELANVSIPTIGRMIASDGPVSGIANNVIAIRKALEAAGVAFIAPGSDGGAGVRLVSAPKPGPKPLPEPTKKPKPAASRRKPRKI